MREILLFVLSAAIAIVLAALGITVPSASSIWKWFIWGGTSIFVGGAVVGLWCIIQPSAEKNILGLLALGAGSALITTSIFLLINSSSTNSESGVNNTELSSSNREPQTVESVVLKPEGSNASDGSSASSPQLNKAKNQSSGMSLKDNAGTVGAEFSDPPLQSQPGSVGLDVSGNNQTINGANISGPYRTGMRVSGSHHRFNGDINIQYVPPGAEAEVARASAEIWIKQSGRKTIRVDGMQMNGDDTIRFANVYFIREADPNVIFEYKDMYLECPLHSPKEFVIKDFVCKIIKRK